MRLRHWLYSVPLRLRSLFLRARVDEELDEELRFHVERRIEEEIANGVPPEEARYKALRDMGGVERRKEECRDTRHTQLIEELVQDIRYACRSLAKSPGFAAITLLSLGLGIGASTAIFNVVNGVLLRGLPFREPDRVVSIHEKIPKWMDRDLPFSPPDYLVLTQQRDWFASTGAYRNVQYELSGAGAPESITGARVTASLFETLGVGAALGRTFTEVEDNERRGVALLGHAYWSRKFGQDPSAIGRTLHLDRQVYTIIGVLPSSFVFPPRGPDDNGRPADVFVPMSFTPGQKQSYGMLYSHSVVARLKPGIGIEQVRAAAPALARRFEETYPAFFQKIPGFSLAVTIAPFREEVVGKVRTLLWVMFAAVLLVLLIGCANVANLMLARAAGRAREMALRAALGAGRLRLVRQVLVESMVLALGGGALGILLAGLSMRALIAASPMQLPLSEAVMMDQRALVFAVAISVLTALIFGLAPAIEGSRGEASDALRDGGHGRTPGQRRRRWLRSFVALQVASAVVLAVGAGLLMRSFNKLLQTDPGFKPQHVLGLSLYLPAQTYREAAQVTGFWDRLREHLASIPGVDAVGLGDLPLTVREGRAIWPEDPSAFDSNPPMIRHAWVHGEYFRALSVPLLKGRWFTDRDGRDAERTIVLNQTMARIFYPGRDPIGQRLKWGGTAESKNPWMTVVGVVADMKQKSLHETTMPMTFTPVAQEPDQVVAPPISMVRRMNVAVRTGGDPAAIASAVRRTIAELDPVLPISDLRTMDELVSESAAPQRFSTSLLGVFAAIALLLATLGIAGVVAYAVAQRTREIGLRIALGASRGIILALALREGLVYAGLGIALGVVVAVGLTRLMTSLLYGVEATDTITFAGVIGLIGLVAGLASLLPAYRATRVDPMVALRNE